MRLIIHIHVIDKNSLGVVVHVCGLAQIDGDVVLRVVGIEPVAERLDAVLDKFLLRRFRGDGVGLRIDGRGNALEAGKRETVDAVICLGFENQPRQAA